MVVNDLDIHGPNVCPDKAQSPLHVDADAVLALPILLQRFKMVAGWRTKEIERLSRVELSQFSLCNRCERLESPWVLAFEESLGFLTLERLGECITRRVRALGRHAGTAEEIPATTNERLELRAGADS